MGIGMEKDLERRTKAELIAMLLQGKAGSEKSVEGKKQRGKAGEVDWTRYGTHHLAFKVRLSLC